MPSSRRRGDDIRQFILKHVSLHPQDIVRISSDHFKVSRQAINKHLKKLVEDQVLAEDGNTRSRTYKLVHLGDWIKEYEITPKLAEDYIWSTDIAPLLSAYDENVIDIWHFGFTEMFNNALDHSGGTKIFVYMRKTAYSTGLHITDNGIGIFKKIQTALNLLDERHSVLELAKGKFTTSPNHHSGEGIFFTSRMFDNFNIVSGTTSLSHSSDGTGDWIFERSEAIEGTSLYMELENRTSTTTKKVFDKYSSGDDYGFTKTIVPVKLAQYGNDKLISRSQAKRMLARVELFKTVIFDFKEVPTIGQAFADEIFRVFAALHPEIKVLHIHGNTEVKRMIARATSQGA